MNIEKKPFVAYSLDSEKGKYGKPFTIRLNEWERSQLDKIKVMFDIKTDGTALKIAAFSYLKVLQSHLTPKYFSWLFKKERKRLSDYDDIDKLISEKL